MFTKEDSLLLQEQAKRSKDAKERERLRALYAINVGYPIQRVAEIFCVDQGTIYRWIERWQEDKNLLDKPKRGRPGRITEDDKRVIRALINEGNPKKYGIDAQSWNTKEIKIYFSKEGKELSRETIRRCLREMGARYVKTSQASTEADRDRWEEFVKVLVTTLEYNPRSILPLFEDEGPGQNESQRWTFDKKGHIKILRNDKEECLEMESDLKIDKEDESDCSQESEES
jgi:transposase